MTLGSQICDKDGYQGPSRRERSKQFHAALQVLRENTLQIPWRGVDDLGIDDDEDASRCPRQSADADKSREEGRGGQ